MQSGAKNKAELLAEAYAARIENGLLGAPGQTFPTVRELAEKERISPATAQKVFCRLEASRLIGCFHKRYYLTHGRMEETSPLFSVLRQNAAFSSRPMMGVLVPDLENPFFSALVQRISTSVLEQGYVPLAMSYQQDEKLEEELLDLLISMGARGIIACPNSNASAKRLYSGCVLPVVFVSRKYLNEANYASVDNYGAAAQAADHLCEMGYTSFMYIGNEWNHSEDQRFHGFFHRLEERMRGAPIPNETCFFLKDTGQLPYYVLQRIVKAPKPLGIFCYHDLIAERVLSACKKQGLSVPHEVGIIGFDDLPVTTQVEPSLSSIAYSFSRLARLTVEKLLHRIDRTENETASRSEDISFMLVTRDSTRRK